MLLYTPYLAVSTQQQQQPYLARVRRGRLCSNNYLLLIIVRNGLSSSSIKSLINIITHNR